MEGISLTTKALGKINLNLFITGRLVSGYHLINSLVTPISLCDEVRIDIIQGSGRITVDTVISEELKKHIEYSRLVDSTIDDSLHGLGGKRNLAYKAVETFFSKFPPKRQVDIAVQIKKNIPFGAGLGGGSADAAAVLLLLRGEFDQNISDESLGKIAVSIGADVPVLLLRSITLMAGIGNRTYPVFGPGVPMIKEIGALIVKPPYAVNTHKAYALFGLKPTIPESVAYGSDNLIGSRSIECLRNMSLDHYEPEKAFNFRAESLTTLSQEGKCVQPNSVGFFSSFVRGLENDFEKVVCLAHPEIGLVKQELNELGAATTVLTGSGSAFVCYFRDQSEARNFAEKLKNKKNEGWFLAPVALDPLG